MLIRNCATDDKNDTLTDTKLVTYLDYVTYKITDNGSSTENIEKTDSIKNDVCRPCPGLVRWALQINGEYSGINSYTRKYLD